ncbi:MAG: enoyl-CoA hydratase [Actinobacteria bacterium]|nr:enoyl-CoA hydratase [Actinomycetota bacterium]NIU65522.1 enoyl-CoA hydratase [Actinomycetota bacterium]NIW27339.1 enoyl-CoA hydratase [Actinomycetota bacterium]
MHFDDDEVRSVAISANGEAFCAGADLKQVRALPDLKAAEAYRWPTDIVAAHELMLEAPKPVIAAVQGPAYAGGLGLAGMCDVVLATENATFATPEVKIGLFPMIIVAHLARSIPRKVLLEMMFTGDPIDAAEAHRIGLVSRVVPDRDALDAAVGEYARKFERVSPEAVRLGRRTFAILADMPADAALRSAQFFNTTFFGSDDFAEGTAAFLEKRRPGWDPDA